MTQNMVYTWNTAKTSEGYRWTVGKFAYQIPAIELKSGICATRAQAVGAAKKWKMYLHPA